MHVPTSTSDWRALNARYTANADQHQVLELLRASSRDNESRMEEGSIGHCDVRYVAARTNGIQTFNITLYDAKAAEGGIVT
jgi:hypothetical protein